jgi:hypothetical protein
MYFSKQVLRVETHEKIYDNMAILTIDVPQSVDTANAREVPITFQEIRTTQARTTTIPDHYGRSGQTGLNAGTASTGSATISTDSRAGGTGTSGSNQGTGSTEADNRTPATLLHTGNRMINEAGGVKAMVGNLFGGGR